MVYEDQFIEAYLALEPLLTTDEQSAAQEEALWLAERLCAGIASQRRLTTRYNAEHGPPGEGGVATRKWQKAFEAWELVGRLNVLGADLRWGESAPGYVYRHAFARRLLAEYPDTKHRAAAEFYAIEPGRDTPEHVDPWIAALGAYIERYSASDTFEVAYARRALAGIYGSLWQLLTHASHIAEATPFKTGDPEQDAARAEGYRRLALRHYADYMLSSAGQSFMSHPDMLHKNVRELRAGEPHASYWMLGD